MVSRIEDVRLFDGRRTEVYAMCREGVRAFVKKLQEEGIGDLEQRDWCTVADGFGDGEGPAELLIERCPLCNEPFPIVKRVLESVAYNFPDVAAYQRLRLDAPCLALGYVTSKTTQKWNPDNYPSLRERWQGLLWHVYDVAFVDVRNGRVDEFCPEEDWGVGDPSPQLANIVADLREPLERALRDGCIPVYTQQRPEGDSKATEPVIEEILTPVLCKYGYRFAGSQVWGIGFWCGFYLDLLYDCEKDQSSIGIEVKVNEDWNHPINQPLKNLLCRNAVLNIRVPPELDKLECKDKKLVYSPAWGLVKKAQDKLKDAGRAAFVYVWPEGAEPKV